MSYGLQVWDASGNLTLDTTDRITRYHGSVTVGSIPALQTVSISVPGLSLDGTWFLVMKGVLSFVRMYVTYGYINFTNTIEYDYDGSSTVIDIFRG